MNFFDDIDKFGNSIAIITENSYPISYSTLVNEADALKVNFKKRCLGFCVCENNFESLVGYIGMLRAKVVPVLVSDGINVELFQGLLQSYKPEYVWISQSNAGYVNNSKVIYRFGEYILLKTCLDMDYEIHKDLAILLTTSGSTGSPKLVKQSYKNIISNANAIAQYLDIKDFDRPITTLPMSYTYGLSIINSHLLKGASIIFTNKTLMDKAFWELLKKYNATTFGGVPYIYEMLKKLRFSRMKLPSLKILTQAGGKLSVELSSEFAEICEQKGIKFIVMYGQTEATARMSYLPCEFARSKAGSIGLPIPGGKFSILDEDGQVITQCNTSGELIYRGDNVTMGYAQNCYDLSKGDENSGILKTGDMAMVDTDGFYYITGRKKRFLKLFGSRVNLDEVEWLLNKSGFECVCTGVDDELKVYTTNPRKEEVRDFVLNHTEINPKGFTVHYIETIPRNDSGKVMYAKI